MKSIAVAISLFLVSTLIFAQSESGRATLEGRVSDASARLVQGAAIAAREMSTGFTRQAVTNTEGKFRIGALPVLRNGELVGIFSMRVNAAIGSKCERRAG